MMMTELLQDLARAMGWSMSTGVNITLSKPGHQMIQVHYRNEASVVAALIQAAESKPLVRFP